MKALAIAAVAAGVAASTARADGLPVLGVDVGPIGVTVPGTDVRYATIPAPARTLVVAISVEGGQIRSFSYLRGSWTVPAVAYDWTAGGLSADGRTLVLLEPRAGFPRARTRFAVLNTRTLRTRGVVALRGDYSFDAVSPDGRTLYLIHYLKPDDPSRYEVRAYDLDGGRLLPEPVVDPEERGEEMRGNPLTRVAGPDGRWTYTLYDGAGSHPFVHALDTVGRTARCIDLDRLAGRNLGAARLTLAGHTLTVRLRGRPLAQIDTDTFALSSPPPAASAPPLDGDGPPWGALAAALLVALLGVGVASLSARRYRAAGRLLEERGPRSTLA